MSVYVDKLFALESKDARAFFVGTRTGHRWCHMWADKDEELHEMAAKLGLKRSWFQPHHRVSHYDLVPSKRALALRLGAVEKSLRQEIEERRML